MRGLDSLIVKAYLKDSSIICRDCGEKEGLTARFAVTQYELDSFLSGGACACGQRWPVSCESCEGIVDEGSEGEGPCPDHHPVCEECGGIERSGELDVDGRCGDCHELACEGCNVVQGDWTDLVLGRCPDCREIDEEIEETNGAGTPLRVLSDDVLVRFGYEHVDRVLPGGKVHPSKYVVVDSSGQPAAGRRSSYGRLVCDPETWSVVLGTDFRRWTANKANDATLGALLSEADRLQAQLAEVEAALANVNEQIYERETFWTGELAEVALPLVNSKRCAEKLEKRVARHRELPDGLALGPSVLVQIDRALNRKTGEAAFSRWGARPQRIGRLIKRTRLQREARRLRREEV